MADDGEEWVAAAPPGEEVVAAAPREADARPSIASSSDEIVPAGAAFGADGVIGEDRAEPAPPAADDEDWEDERVAMMQRIDQSFIDAAYVNSTCVLCGLAMGAAACLLGCDHATHAGCAAMYIGWCAVHGVNPTCMVTDMRGNACGGVFVVTRSEWDPSKVLYGCAPNSMPPPDVVKTRDAAWCARKTRSLARRLYAVDAVGRVAGFGLMFALFVALAIGAALLINLAFGPL